MTKQEIRELINKKLKGMTKQDIDSKSESILFNLQKSKLLDDKKSIMFYLNIKNEVKTDFMLEYFKDKNIYLPKVNGNNMNAYKFISFEDLEIGSFGIREPKKSKEPENLDAVIVPLVAISRKGERIGKGKGYYDKFLSRYNTLKIGICYDFQIVDNIIKEEQDINLDYIITNKEIIKVENS